MVMSHKINETALELVLIMPIIGTTLRYIDSKLTLIDFNAFYSFQLSIIATIHSIYESCNREKSAKILFSHF